MTTDTIILELLPVMLKLNSPHCQPRAPDSFCCADRISCLDVPVSLWTAPVEPEKKMVFNATSFIPLLTVLCEKKKYSGPQKHLVKIFCSQPGMADVLCGASAAV